MLNFKEIKESYPLAFKKMQQFFNDGIGHCSVENKWGYEGILWWNGDSPELDHRIDDYELYSFFDSQGIYVVVKIDSLSPRSGYFVFDVYTYYEGRFIGEMNQQPYNGNTRIDAQDDGFDFAFEKLEYILLLKE